MKIGIFASDKASNDASRLPLLNQVGAQLAKQNANLMAMQGQAGLPMTTLAAGVAAGARAKLFVAQGFEVPQAIASAEVEILPSIQEQADALQNAIDVNLLLPGALATASDLVQSTLKSNVQSRPILVLNIDNAFAFFRGFLSDVMSQNHPRPEDHLQFADSLDDMRVKLEKMATAQR